MIIMLMNFIWIFVSSLAIGILVCKVLISPERGGSRIELELDLVLMMGILGLTVYAEIFSLFHRVGFAATGILFFLDLLILIGFRKDMGFYFFKIYNAINRKYILAILLILIPFFLVIATQSPDFYDTSLYHGQAIQWIEKYGVVKGLGNLHNRFAYNSAFLCLQALFSWNSILGQSLHGVNAYLGLIMSVYALISFARLKRKESKIYISDFFNLLILFFIFNSLGSIASPNTDFFAMLISLYVLLKWLREYEEKTVATRYIYGTLCILIIYGVTLKLSIVPFIILAIKPVIHYIRRKNYKIFFRYCVVAMGVVLPFLVRNFLISGYLLYPYASLDVFCVDWKMPSYTVIFDNHEILTWGRGLNDAAKIGTPFTEWFREWFLGLETNYKILLVLNGVLICFSILFVVNVIKLKRQSEMADLLLVIGVSISSLCMWIFTAPLIRYGGVYLQLLPTLYFGFYAVTFLQKRGLLMAILLVGLILPIRGGVAYALNIENVPLYRPQDYPIYECYSVDFQNCEMIYLPVDGDRTGYCYFPAIPYSRRLDVIELRGTGFKEGFKMKSGFRDANVNTYGSIDK